MTGAGRLARVLVLVVVLSGCGGIDPTTSGNPSPTASGSDSTSDAVAITEASLRDRLDALSAVSTRADGYRAVGSAGFDKTADLVEEALRASGWQVREDAFETPAFYDDGSAMLEAGEHDFGAGDVSPLIFAPAGDVAGPVVAIDWETGQSTGRGCAAAGYGDLPAGAIVLVPPGGCFRRDQVVAAQQAGAAAFLAGYPAVGSGEVLRPTLLEPDGLMIPAAAVSQPVVDVLTQPGVDGSSITLRTNARTEPVTTRSIIADLPGSQPDTVIMLGSHLDSVVDGPGINDNGSGVAALLEVARELADSHPAATIRLGFWTAEETGLHGSFHYIDGLSASDRKAIRAYLNADMVASPNGYAGVYDEDGAAPGSAVIRDMLLTAIERAGGDPVPVTLGGGSDHVAFQQAGIPIGGIFSGANERITDEQARSAGSNAGEAADPCYHQACDDGTGLDLGLAQRLTAALADVVRDLAGDPARLAN